MNEVAGNSHGKAILQLIRYGLVGGLTNLLLYLGYLLVTYVGAEPKKSMTLVYLVGVGIGFYGHRQWTFAHDGSARQSMVRYCIAHALGYLINLVLLVGLVDRMGYPHELVQGAAILIVAAFLFVMFKYWVFPRENMHVVH
jgi:putative flippase GtrA